MTPPPSSQTPHPSLPQIRTPTPTHSHLSSPPPTTKGPTTTRLTSEKGVGTFTSDQIRDANMEELRQMVTVASAESREARASAAHYSLQYQLLGLESSEAMKRMAVELEMKEKEVRVLQQAVYKRGPGFSSTSDQSMPTTVTVPSPGSEKMLVRLRSVCEELEAENETLRRRLEDAKAALLEREDTLYEENERLRDRIRDNRKHTNLIREAASGEGVTHSVADPLLPAIGTLKERESDGLATLLEAGQALSHEPATAPSTPVPKKRAQPGHSRTSQSLSSLPTTPHRSVPAPNRYSGPYYITKSNMQTPIAPRTAPQPRVQKRRESRDSTISASDSEEGGPRSVVSLQPGDSDWIGESPASQEAARLLRQHRRRELEQRGRTQVAHSPSSTAARKSSDMLQSKLYGYQITKPGAGQGEMIKRRFYDDGSPPSARPLKKPRIGEGVGLGIAGVSPTR